MKIRDLFTRKPSPSQAASTLSKHGAAQRKATARERYIAFHNEMASRYGLRIEWAE